MDIFSSKISQDQAKDTGMAMVLICLLIMLFSGRNLFLVPAIAVLVLTMTWPAFFKPVARLWLGFSHFLGSIVSKILLSVLFFVIVTPIGLVRRFAGADSLKLKDWRTGTTSSFIDRNKTYSAKDLEHPY
ncbi:MAG: SxtJ family membrane protein [Desulfobulbaceae bacterium]|nr:SxtJ family membrane protein [Desulfobulbaceae bacterium]